MRAVFTDSVDGVFKVLTAGGGTVLGHGGSEWKEELRKWMK